MSIFSVHTKICTLNLQINGNNTYFSRNIEEFEEYFKRVLNDMGAAILPSEKADTGFPA